MWVASAIRKPRSCAVSAASHSTIMDSTSQQEPDRESASCMETMHARFCPCDLVRIGCCVVSPTRVRMTAFSCNLSRTRNAPGRLATARWEAEACAARMQQCNHAHWKPSGMRSAKAHRVGIEHGIMLLRLLAKKGSPMKWVLFGTGF